MIPATKYGQSFPLVVDFIIQKLHNSDLESISNACNEKMEHEIPI